MTNTEALKIINVNGYGYPETEAAEAHRIIEREMGFRTAVVPTPTQGASMFGEGKCPTCGNLVYRPDNYCNMCGQELDWSEVEE